MEMREIPEELYESYPAMSAKYHADMIEEYVQERLTASKARLSEAVKVLEVFAIEADQWEGYPDNEVLGTNYHDFNGEIHVGHLRAAKAFIATLGENKNENS